MALKVMGIIGIVFGVIIIVMTATHGLGNSSTGQGYISGLLLIVFGALRFMRGNRRY